MEIKYWFTADLHLGHSNILRICNRPFKTIEEHDDEIINRHNSLIQDGDIVYNLGDVGYRSSSSYMVKRLRDMNGKIVIILGNHDKALRESLQRGFLDKELRSGKIEIVGGREAAFDKSLALSKMLNIDGQLIFISHYGHRTWPSAFRGAWHLYGHSHNNLPSHYRSFDVGVDTNNFYPYSFRDITTKMESIPLEFSENGDPEKIVAAKADNVCTID